MSQETQIAGSAKEKVRHLLDRLPDDCTIEDVQYHLYVIEKAQRGFDEIDNGNGIPHDQIEREFLE